MDSSVLDPVILDGVSVIGTNESGDAATRLEDVRLTLARGEWLYVVGVNGSGKSTLARTLAGLYTEGLVGSYSRGFAGEACSPIVLQQPEAQLFGETPREEAQFALEWRQTPAERIASMAEDVLRRVGLLALADEPWERLSGGQRQLAAFAAAIAGGAPPMLVLDEATSMLDEANRETIERESRRLQREGTAIVWVTQRLDELAPDSRVVVMESGRVLFDGGVREMLFGQSGDAGAKAEAGTRAEAAENADDPRQVGARAASNAAPNAESRDSVPPCERAGLRLPYLSSLALQLRRNGRLEGVLPVTAAEWQAASLTPVDECLSGASETPIGYSVDLLTSSGGHSSTFHSRPPLRAEGVPWRDASVETVRDEGLELTAGKLTLLIGANGAGKTTLLEKLAGLRPPEKLNPSYGDEPVWVAGRWGKRKLNARSLMHYSYVPQSAENGLFARTLAEELRFSARPYRLGTEQLAERMTGALTAVGWSEPWMARDPYLMSGGERRRAALAASFVPPVAWLLMDEPTAGLDGVGHEIVGRYLMSLKENGTGMLLISHDLDWALPLADDVLLLDAEGVVRRCTPKQLLAHPEWLREAGIAVPLWLEIARRLHLQGIPAERLWSPRDAASEILVHEDIAEGNVVDVINDINSSARTAGNDTAAGDRATGQSGGTIITRIRGEVPGARHRLGSFDPRTIWLSYVLLSIGIFAQSSWFGIATAGAVTLLLLAAGRISLWRWRSLLQGYAIFSIVASAFFAIGAGSGGMSFDTDAFAGMLLPFTRTYIVLLLGLGIPLVMTPLSLRNALQKLLTFGGKTPGPAHRLILTVTIMIRFIPVLVAEWGKFARIELSRGKLRSGKAWRIVARMRDMALPFMLSLFRLGDEIAVALESRGVTMDSRPTSATKLRWAGRDYAFVVCALLLAVAMWMYARVWG